MKVSVDYFLIGEEKNSGHFFNNTIYNNSVEFNNVENGGTITSSTKYTKITHHIDNLSFRNCRRDELKITEFLEDKYSIK